MLLGLDCSANGIQGMFGGLLALHSDGAIVCKGVEGPAILSLKHHVELFPASMAFVSLLHVDVKGFLVVDCLSVEDLPVLGLVRGVELEGGGFPAGIGVKGMVVYAKNCLGSWGTVLLSEEIV